MIKKYKVITGYRNAEIEEVNVITEDDHSVCLPAIKGPNSKEGSFFEPKKTTWYEYHDTWQSAHAVLMEHTKSEVERHTKALARAIAFAQEVNKMTNNNNLKDGQ